MQHSHSEPPFPKLRTSRTPYRSYANYAGKYDANEKIFRLHKTEKSLNDLAFRRNAVSGKLLLKRKKLMKMQHSVKTMAGLAAMPARAALLVNRTSEAPDAATGGFRYYREMGSETVRYGKKITKPLGKATRKPMRAAGQKLRKTVAKGMKHAGKGIKTAAKTTKLGAKASEATAKASAKTSVQLTKAAIAAAKAAAKAIAAAIKEVVAIIASGGTAAVVLAVVLLVVLMVLMLLFSPFGSLTGSNQESKLPTLIEEAEEDYWNEVTALAGDYSIQWENGDPVVYFTVRNPREIYALAYVTGDSETVIDRIRTMLYTFYPYDVSYTDEEEPYIYISQRPWESVADEYHLDETSRDYIRLMLSADFDEAWYEVYNRLSVIPADGLVNAGGALPIPNLTAYGISSQFGERNGGFHHGLDLLCSWHSEVLAVKDGTVYAVDTTVNDGLGNSVILQHTAEDGSVFYTVYGHLSSVYAQVGQTVSTGAILGLEGGDPKNDPNPGASTGHHLHFEIRTAPTQASAIDPYPYLYAETESSSPDAA